MVHAGRPGTGPELKPGMFFTVEPMINIGRADVKLLDDGWTAVTRDRSLSAQCEHTVAVTDDGAEILTRLPGDDNDLEGLLTYQSRLRWPQGLPGGVARRSALLIARSSRAAPHGSP